MFGVPARWPAVLAGIASLGIAQAVPAQALQPVPSLERRVTDLTGMLSPAQQQALESRLAAFEERKGSQLAILIVATTLPESIEQYSIRVAEQWQLGRSGVDDGVLLLVAVEDRAMRLEVGYGLEGAIPDAIAKRIVSDVITPYFRQGDYYGGLEAGAERILGAIDGEPLPEPETGWRENIETGESLLPLLLVFAIVAGGLLRALLGRFAGAAVTGGLAGGLVWLLVHLLGIAIVAAVVTFVVVLVGGLPRRGWSTRGRGSGGFGGLGGGFGGGGASGRW